MECPPSLFELWRDEGSVILLGCKYPEDCDPCPERNTLHEEPGGRILSLRRYSVGHICDDGRRCLAPFGRRLPRPRAGVGLGSVLQNRHTHRPLPRPFSPQSRRRRDWGEKGRGRGILTQSGMVAGNRAPPRHETGGASQTAKQVPHGRGFFRPWLPSWSAHHRFGGHQSASSVSLRDSKCDLEPWTLDDKRVSSIQYPLFTDHRLRLLCAAYR